LKQQHQGRGCCPPTYVARRLRRHYPVLYTGRKTAWFRRHEVASFDLPGPLGQGHPRITVAEDDVRHAADRNYELPRARRLSFPVAGT